MDATLQTLTENKNIVLVGNSVEILRHEYGKYIDSFDTVVRFGRGIPDWGNFDAIGKRTDIWITGWLRMENHTFFPKAYKLFNRCRIHLNKEVKKKIPFEYTNLFTDEELYKVFEQVGAKNGVPEGDRPSAGFLGILFFLNKCKCKSITLIGFDFFSKRIPVMTGTDYPASWHMPINSVYKNPHNSKEKETVMRWFEEGRLNWKILSDLDEGLLDLS